MAFIFQKSEFIYQIPIIKSNYRQSPSISSHKYFLIQVFLSLARTAWHSHRQFSPDHLTLIIYKYGELKSVVSVMRACRKQFYPQEPISYTF